MEEEVLVKNNPRRRPIGLNQPPPMPAELLDTSLLVAATSAQENVEPIDRPKRSTSLSRAMLRREESVKVLVEKGVVSVGWFFEVIVPKLTAVYVMFLELQLALAPYRLRLLVPFLVGLIMCFFGGSYMVLIAAVEAFLMCGYESTLLCLQRVSDDFRVFIEENRKDNTIAEDLLSNRGFDRSLLQRKITLFLRTIDPHRLSGLFFLIFFFLFSKKLI